jgi:uncharacterized protein YecE (DUF72 family)
MNSVEVNGSFYSLQRPSSWRTWSAAVPDDFAFAVKGPRSITHMKKLTDPQVPLANFFATGLLSLGHQLAPSSGSCRPTLGFHPLRLAAFFDFPAADDHSGCSAREELHEPDRLAEGPDTSTSDERELRHVLEVRHDSFRTPDFCELLRAHNIGWSSRTPRARGPLFDEVTADLVYVRLHGDVELYASGYSDDALARWADKIRAGTPRAGRVRLLRQRHPRARTVRRDHLGEHPPQ